MTYNFAEVFAKIIDIQIIKGKKNYFIEINYKINSIMAIIAYKGVSIKWYVFIYNLNEPDKKKYVINAYCIHRYTHEHT